MNNLESLKNLEESELAKVNGGCFDPIDTMIDWINDMFF